MADTPRSGRNSRSSRGSAQTQTPRGRVDAQPAPSSSRSIHTPLDRTAPRDLANSVRRGLSESGGRRNNAPTPHAAAAMRARELRRTALLTPGKNRRKSAMAQRETPRDLLRQLGRALVPNSEVIASSSSPGDRRSSIPPVLEESEEDDDLPPKTTVNDVDDDDDELPARPRFSLPIDQDDDSELSTPQVTELVDDTMQSIPLPRRTLPGDVAGQYSRGSIGSRRPSEYFENDDVTENEGRQSDFFPGFMENLQATDAAYGRIDNDVTRRTTLGRESDFQFDVPGGMDDPTATFMMSEPPQDMEMTSPAPIEEGRTAGQGAEITGNITFIPEDPSVMPDIGYDETGNITVPNFGPDVEDDSPDDAAEDDEEPDQTQIDASMMQETPRPGRGRPKAKKKVKRISRHGTPYPPLPAPFVKRVAHRALQSSGLSNTRLSTDVVAALTQASEWFFEQLGDDLGAYADHAKRKTIEESDVITLMRRYVNFCC